MSARQNPSAVLFSRIIAPLGKSVRTVDILYCRAMKHAARRRAGASRHRLEIVKSCHQAIDMNEPSLPVSLLARKLNGRGAQ